MMQCLKSSLVKKYIMAVTGLGLIGFAFAHLLGNLQMFAGPEAVNSYAQKLKDLGPLLWVARIGLLGMFFGHIATAIMLRIDNKSARPIPYKANATLKATLASRTMALSGLVLLAYVIYHLMHFTWHWVDPQFSELMDARQRHDVYAMVVSGFKHPSIVIGYVVAMFFLSLHISHGASSVFQSLGCNTARSRVITSKIGPALGVILFVGYSSIPLSVLLGIIK